MSTPETSAVSHTPGPWRSVFSEMGGYDCMTHAFHVKAGNRIVATLDLGSYGQSPCDFTDRGGWSDEASANAHLIEAAPQMLDALRHIAKFSGDPVMEAVANGAIARAEGKS